MPSRRTIGLSKTVPYVWQEVGRYTLARVFDFDCYPARRFDIAASDAILLQESRPYFDVAPCRGELDRVRQQVPQNLLHTLGIVINYRQVTGQVQFDLQLACVRCLPYGLHRVQHRKIHVRRLQVEPEYSPLQTRQIEQI